MSAETLIKVSLVILFLLYAYFMIGGPTPCPCPLSNSIPNINFNSQQLPYSPIVYPTNTYHGPTNNSFDKNIYQMSPYLNI